MDIQFIIIQIIGAAAWLFLLASYYRENTNKILFFQIISIILYCIHYFFLQAYSGLFICLFEVIIHTLYYKTDLDFYVYLICVPIYIIGGMLSASTFIEVLPIVASLIESYSLIKNKKKIVIGAIISYTLWVIYDIYVMSYSGAITDGLIVLSNISILLFNYDFFSKNQRKKAN